MKEAGDDMMYETAYKEYIGIFSILSTRYKICHYLVEVVSIKG